MNPHTRNSFKWSVNEVLSLQREFELLGWSIDQISEKHKRTPNAIMYKLDQEGFADYNVLYSNYHDLNAPIPVEKKTDDIWLEHDDSEDEESQVDDDEEYVEKKTDDIWLEHDDSEDEESQVDDDEEYVENADGEDNDSGDEDDEDDYVADLSERVYGLEESVSEIRDMIKQMMSTFSKSSSSKSWF